jgi:hypothetical protein
MRAWCIFVLVAGCGGAAVDGAAGDADSDFRHRGDGGVKPRHDLGSAAPTPDGGGGGGAADQGSGASTGGGGGGASTGGSGGGGGSTGAACGTTVAGDASERLKLVQSRIVPGDWPQNDAIGDQVFWSSLAWDSGRNELIVFGGRTHDLKPAQTWKWDGSAFSVVATADKSPTQRSQFAMVYDANRGRIVLFGGFDNQDVLGDLWEWDGTRWNPIAFKNGPSARARHSMAYDSARKRVVLFGGGDLNGDFADTWEWDGANWTQTPAAPGGPPARQYAGMAFDPVTARTVLVGGEAWSYGNGAAPLDGTTWEWDGSAWSKAGTSTARGGAHVMLVDEPLLGGLVMYGGTIWDEYNAGMFTEQRPDLEASDFWLWKGRAWTQLANRSGTAPELAGYLYFPADSITPEQGPEHYHWGAAWDDCRQRLVMFRHDWDSGDLWVTEIADAWSPDSAPVIVNPPQAQEVAPPSLEVSFPLMASDADADVLTWSTGTLPAGASFSITAWGGQFTWGPTVAQVGDYSVDFFVSDGTLTTKWTVPIHVGAITYAGFASGSFSQTGSALLTVDELVSEFSDDGTWLWYNNGPSRSAYASCTLSGNNPGVFTLACSIAINQPSPVGVYNGSATGTVPQSEVLAQSVSGDVTGRWQVTLQPQPDGSTVAQLTQGTDLLRHLDDLAWQHGTVTLTLK